MKKDEGQDIAIRIDRISKYFPGVQALNEFSLDVKRGEVHALVGENGAGKSTLMKIIAREYYQDEGDVFIEGRNVKYYGAQKVQELGLSLIHQEQNLVPTFTVGQNICLGHEPTTRFKTVDWKGIQQKAGNFLNEISSDINPKSNIEGLSISEKQLVIIARALITYPRILILDEPTAQLDQKASDDLFSFLDRAKEKGLTVIYISHRLEEIYRICDRITVLRDGKKIITAPVKELPREELFKYILGREMGQQVPKEEVLAGKVVLSVRKLYGKTKGGDINFDLRKGEILGLTGSIGAGKTEVVRAIFGADRKKSGIITISGRDLKNTNPIDSIAAGIAYVPEERQEEGLVLNESIRKNLTLVTLDKKFCNGGLWINQDEEKKAAKKLIETLRIATPSPEKEVRFLSGGTQQKVVVGKWLMSEAKIYIFDEPTKGVDIGGKQEIYRCVVELAKMGVAVIFVSNELSEMLLLCDRILVMYHGRIIKELSSKESSREELLFYIMGGENGN